MSKETEVIVKQMLLQVLGAKSLKDAQEAIKFLATKEDVAEAQRIIAERDES